MVRAVRPFEEGEHVVPCYAEGRRGEEVEDGVAERLGWSEGESGGGEKGVQIEDCEEVQCQGKEGNNVLDCGW